MLRLLKRIGADIAGYDKRSVDFAQDAIATTLQGAGVLTGNAIAVVLVNRFNTLVNCYQERGAVDARIYTQRLTDAVSGAAQGQFPIGGFLAVINVN
ncbi:MAG: hypothetical protein H7Y09_05755, partial [Chitinophagaceae bacterium]|nr:hypothetical protein [Anaerolineae bacterium]